MQTNLSEIENADSPVVKKPELQDFGITLGEYNLYKTDRKSFDISALVPKYIAIAACVLVAVVLGCVFVIGSLSAGTGGGFAAFCLAVLIAFVMLLGRKISDWYLSRTEQRETKLALANIMALQIKLYEEANAAYLKAEAVRHESEMARQEAERVAEEERQEKERIVEQARISAERIRRRKMEDHWTSLDGIQFEQELAVLFKHLGYDVESTPVSGDQGIDLVLKRKNRTTVVQCKAHKRPIGPAVVRELYGTMVAAKANHAALVCTGGFTKGVREFAENKPITLWETQDIVAYCDRVSETDPDSLKIDESVDAPPKCPEPGCGERLIRRESKLNIFWGCPKFPACKGTRQIS